MILVLLLGLKPGSNKANYPGLKAGVIFIHRERTLVRSSQFENQLYRVWFKASNMGFITNIL